MHPAALRLPAPKSTGDEVADATNQANFESLQEMVSILLQDNSHVPVLYPQLRKRMNSQASKGDLDDAMLFKTTNPSLKSVEADWLLDFIDSHSDMDVSTLVRAQSADTENLVFLASFATQLPPTMKMPKECQIRPVYRKVLDTRAADCGNRLATFKADGNISASGGISFLHGSYQPTFASNGQLTHIKHISGDTVAVDNSGVNKDHYSLQDNWSDWGAAFVRRPMPPIKCHIFFKTGKHEEAKGPYKVKQFTASSKDLNSYTAGVHDEWDRKRKASEEGVATKEEAQVALQALAKEKRQALAEKAREKAAEVVAAKRRRRSLDFKTPTPAA